MSKGGDGRPHVRHFSRYNTGLEGGVSVEKRRSGGVPDKGFLWPMVLSP